MSLLSPSNNYIVAFHYEKTAKAGEHAEKVTNHSIKSLEKQLAGTKEFAEYYKRAEGRVRKIDSNVLSPEENQKMGAIMDVLFRKLDQDTTVHNWEPDVVQKEDANEHRLQENLRIARNYWAGKLEEFKNKNDKVTKEWERTLTARLNETEKLWNKIRGGGSGETSTSAPEEPQTSNNQTESSSNTSQTQNTPEESNPENNNSNQTNQEEITHQTAQKAAENAKELVKYTQAPPIEEIMNGSDEIKVYQKGESVKIIQKLLNKWIESKNSDNLEPLEVDGFYGPETENTVKKYQVEINDLEETGVVNQDVYEKLIGTNKEGGKGGTPKTPGNSEGSEGGGEPVEEEASLVQKVWAGADKIWYSNVKYNKIKEEKVYKNPKKGEISTIYKYRPIDGVGDKYFVAYITKNNKPGYKTFNVWQKHSIGGKEDFLYDKNDGRTLVFRHQSGEILFDKNEEMIIISNNSWPTLMDSKNNGIKVSDLKTWEEIKGESNNQ